MPNRSYWGTWGWNNRLEQVQHFTNDVYNAVDTICSLFGQHLPNLAYVDDSDTEEAGRGQRHKYATNRSGNYVYNFRHRLVDSYPAEMLDGSRTALAKGWDGAAVIGTHRHATQAYPGYRTYKALSAAQPHEELEPLASHHPLRRLLVDPNRYDTSYSLEYELTLFSMLCGVSYLWAVPDGYGTPCELWVIPAHWVWPRGSDGRNQDPAYQHLIDHYEVRPFGAAGGGYSMVSIPAEEVIAFTCKSPLSKIDGWSKLTAASQRVDTNESMDRSAWAQMQNQGMPSMFIELGEAYKDANDNATARIEAKFAQKLGGEYNVGRPFVGKPGMKMTPLNWAPESMMYPQMRESFKTDVLAAFHLSKIAVGMMDDMTYGSILAGLAHTWIHCLNPYSASVGQRLSKELAPRFADPGYRKWLKEGGQWLDAHNDSILFSSLGKSGYVRDPSGKRRLPTEREEEDGREIRVWWPDGSPPDPAQVNQDIAQDFQCGAITTNEIRAIRGRPPYDLGGDNPLVQGPGGLMPLPLNVEEDMAGLGELVGQFTEAAGEAKPEGGPDGAVGAGGDGMAGGDVDGSGGGNAEQEKPVDELPAGKLDRNIEHPNGKPSKGLNGVHKNGSVKGLDRSRAVADALHAAGYNDWFVERVLGEAPPVSSGELRVRLRRMDATPAVIDRVAADYERNVAKGRLVKSLDPDTGRLLRKDKNGVSVGPIAAGLAVVADDTGRVLLLQRQRVEGEEDPNAGKWEFPGGKMDAGEQPLEAACREWTEEVGHVLPVGKLSRGQWLSGNGKYAGHVYRVATEAAVDLANRRADGDPASGGYAAVAWVDPADLPHHNLRPALLGDLDDVLAQVVKYLTRNLVTKEKINARRNTAAAAGA